MNSLKTILVIDYDNVYGQSIENAIGHKNYKFTYANTSLSGIQKIIQLKPDLIIFNIDLEPVPEGFELIKTLIFTDTFNHIPIVFLFESSIIPTGNKIYNNGNVLISKLIDLKSIIDVIGNLLDQNSIEKKIQYDFNTLFQLSPNGLIIFNKSGIISVNNTILDILKLNQPKEDDLKAENLFEKASWIRIKRWMRSNSSLDNSSFNDQIVLKNKQGERVEKWLVLNKLSENGDGTHFIGFLEQSPRLKTPMISYHLANDLLNLLKRENIIISESMEQKIAQAIKSRSLNVNDKKNSLFTKRENDVLRLSIEGLSIKVIADRLSISSRTVEKHRTKLMEKTGAKNIVEAIVFSIRNNLVEI